MPARPVEYSADAEALTLLAVVHLRDLRKGPRMLSSGEVGPDWRSDRLNRWIRIKLRGIDVELVPGMRACSPDLTAWREKRGIVHARSRYELHQWCLRTANGDRRSALFAKSTHHCPTASRFDCEVLRRAAHEPNSVTGNHSQRGVGTPTCPLAISTMTEKLHDRLFSAFVPNAATRATTREAPDHRPSQTLLKTLRQFSHKLRCCQSAA